MSTCKIKAWIVRQSAFSVQCGGLERLFIHFSKPSYFYEKLNEKDRDNPFCEITEKEGLFKKVGWVSDSKTWVNEQSVGNWLGYDNPISDYIWEELQKHFHNAPFEEWDKLEKEGKSKVDDFLLEIQIELNLIKI